MDRIFSPELVIKQVLMRSLETSEGLTRGRDITEQQFIYNYLAVIHAGLSGAETNWVFQEFPGA